MTDLNDILPNKNHYTRQSLKLQTKTSSNFKTMNPKEAIRIELADFQHVIQAKNTKNSKTLGASVKIKSESVVNSLLQNADKGFKIYGRNSPDLKTQSQH